jgi:hypothetical protein
MNTDYERETKEIGVMRGPELNWKWSLLNMWNEWEKQYYRSVEEEAICRKLKQYNRNLASDIGNIHYIVTSLWLRV